MAGWIISKTEEFQAATTSAREAIRTALRSCKKEIKGSEAKAKALLRKLDALKKFLQAIEEIEAGKVDSLGLPIAIDITGKPIPNIYVLKRGVWRGYYRIDVAAQSVTGLIALETKGDDDRIRALLRALS